LLAKKSLVVKKRRARSKIFNQKVESSEIRPKRLPSNKPATPVKKVARPCKTKPDPPVLEDSSKRVRKAPSKFEEYFVESAQSKPDKS
jgi:hypothetical protein